MWRVFDPLPSPRVRAHPVVRKRIFVIWNEMQYVYSRSEPPLCCCINIGE